MFPKKRKRLLLTAGLVILCVVLVLTYLFNTKFVNAVVALVRDTTTENIAELTISKAQHFDSRIRQDMQAIDLLAQALSAAEGTMDYEAIVADLQETQKASAVWLIDAEGNEWCSKEGSLLYPKSNRGRLFEPALAGETGISDPFYGEDGKKNVMFYTPICRGDELLGAVYMAVPTTEISSIYGLTTYNDAGYSYILERNGGIVIDSSRSTFLQVYDNFDILLRDSGNDEDNIALFMRALANGDMGSAIFDFEGKRQFLYFYPLAEKEGWYFVTILPLDVVENNGTVIVRWTQGLMVAIGSLVLLFVIVLVISVILRERANKRNQSVIHSIYNMLSANIDTAIIIVNAANKAVEVVFDNVETITGYPASCFLKPQIPTDDFVAAVNDFIRTPRLKEKVSRELSLWNEKLGREMWVQITCIPATLGNVEKYVFSLRDVTQDRRIRETLEHSAAMARQASQAKSQFLSNMSHDIRTPMNAIIGFTELALLNIKNQEKVNGYLKKIKTSGNHLLALINDILEMSRIESKKVSLDEVECNLGEVLHDLNTIIAGQLAAKQLSLKMDAKNVVNENVFCDKLRLNQILINLLSNAIKFTPAGGEISVRLLQKESKNPKYGSYEFRVKDTGIGMSAEFAEKVFEPFEREKTSTVSGIQGTGLGMTITKNIVDLMGGSIHVITAPGEGTEFIICVDFKIIDAPSQEVPLEDLKGLRALVVDDDFDACDSTTKMLMKLEVQSEWTMLGREAILRSKQAIELGHAFGIYIIDWQLPDLNGIEVARQIRKIAGSAAPILIMTAYDWTNIECEAREAGVCAFCNKPVFMSDLKAALAKAVGTEQKLSEGNEIKDLLKRKLSGRRILLAEDNQLNREIAIAILEEAGFTVEAAENGAVTVDRIKSAPPGYYDVVLMDIRMPVMDGYEATRAIRALENKKLASIPIIAMTANAFAEDKKAALDAGMNGHVAKPVDIAVLMEALENVLKPL